MLTLQSCKEQLLNGKYLMILGIAKNLNYTLKSRADYSWETLDTIQFQIFF